jgi:hypothetical protein
MGWSTTLLALIEADTGINSPQLHIRMQGNRYSRQQSRRRDRNAVAISSYPPIIDSRARIRLYTLVEVALADLMSCFLLRLKPGL